jgi:hypothetical protein
MHGLPQDLARFGHREHVLLLSAEGSDTAAVAMILETKPDRAVIGLADVHDLVPFA